MGIVPGKFPGIMVLKTFLLQIFSGFSEELVTRNSLELVTRNFLDRVTRISSEYGLQEIPRTWFLGIGNEKFLGKAVDIFTGFSCERLLGISADSQERFLGIFADFPRIFRKIVTWDKCATDLH